MKTYFRTLSTALAAATLLIAGPALAQYQATGTDGITASPKLRQTLDQQQRNNAIPSEPRMAKMACPKCVDSVTRVVDYTARGANKPTVTVLKHGCSDCEYTIATIGVGKAATTTAVHTCNGADMLACCNAAKN